MPWPSSVSGGTSGGGGIDWTSLLLAGGTGVAGAIANSKSKNADRKAEAAALDKTLAAKAAADRLGVAADESKLDPFRQQMAQAGDISKLDRLERATYKPVSISAAPGYEQYVPHLFGGASYEKSPELIQSAAALKRNIMGGNVAPTMTNPDNYDKTAALNLLAMAAAGQDPGTVHASGVGGPTARPSDVDYMSDVTRRGGGSGGGALRSAAGGAMTGASVGSIVPGVGTAIGAGVGALAGAIKGVVGKHAATAPTDVPVAQAQSVLDRAIRQELGRAPQPGEIDALLRAQGLKPGDRWVGDAGLTGLLNHIRTQAIGATRTPSFTGRG
jgi:hypothetical protein